MIVKPSSFNPCPARGRERKHVRHHAASLLHPIFFQNSAGASELGIIPAPAKMLSIRFEQQSRARHDESHAKLQIRSRCE